MKEYQAVVVKLTRHTREDEDTLTDLLNERSRGGWEPALMSQDEQRLTILFSRSAIAEGEASVQVSPDRRGRLAQRGGGAPLGTAHAVAAVVAEVAVAVADGDGSAVVAGRGIGLEVGKLAAADGRAVEFRISKAFRVRRNVGGHTGVTRVCLWRRPARGATISFGCVCGSALRATRR